VKFLLCHSTGLKLESYAFQNLCRYGKAASVSSSFLQLIHRVCLVICIFSILQDAVPLIEQLSFSETYRRAFDLLCKDIATATSYSNSDNLDCITLDGM